jgi:hypothetical protein
MSRLLQTFYLILKALNFWFFVIPSRLLIIAFVGYYFLMDYMIGDQPIYLYNRQLQAAGNFYYYMFWIGLGIPFFFIYMHVRFNKKWGK